MKILGWANLGRFRSGFGSEKQRNILLEIFGICPVDLDMSLKQGVSIECFMFIHCGILTIAREGRKNKLTFQNIFKT